MGTITIDPGNATNPNLEGTDGAAHVRIKADETAPYGQSLHTHVVGTPATKVSSTTGSIYIVDMRTFGKATFVTLTSGTTMLHGASVAWSHDGGSETHTATTLWSSTKAGDQGAAVTVLDNFGHYTLTFDSTGETIYSYLTGRELA